MTTLDVNTSEAASNASMPNATRMRLAMASVCANGRRTRGVAGSMPPAGFIVAERGGRLAAPAGTGSAPGGSLTAISFCAAFSNAAAVSLRSP